MLAGFHAGMILAQPIPAGPIMARAIFSGYNKQAILMCLRERARMSPFQALKCEVYYCYRFGDSKFGAFSYSPAQVAIRCTTEHVDRFDVNYVAVWVHVAPAHRITQHAVARAHVTKVMIHVRGSGAKNGDIDCPPKEIFVQELLGGISQETAELTRSTLGAGLEEGAGQR
ncbi:unnamed protein product [Sphagnum jensenii]|uniref:Uncharacterized protein n=1 Tax=Sphagnum jensenii TaxID=128206 RepID=A0ABP1BNU0_9BRYO